MRTLMLLACCCSLAPAAEAASLSPAGLRCEYRVDPLGVDTRAPRLSWICAASTPGARSVSQSAYRIVVASSESRLAAGEGDLWDSGRVASAETLNLVYAGKPLVSRQQVWWKVRLWDEAGRPSAWSPASTWTMGVLGPGDWAAEWIAPPPPPEGQAGPGPLPLLRRGFNAPRGIRRAVVRVCGLGNYALSLNGEPVNRTFLDPGWTNYRATCPYDTYDVTKAVRSGRNVLGVMLGNGMYNVVGGRYTKFTGSFGEPKLILELSLEYADGTTATIGSDETWRTAEGPVTFTCIYGGEDYDARREQAGWDQPGFEDASWRPAIRVEGPGGVLRTRREPPVSVWQTLEPVSARRLRPGVYVYDLGRNCSAVPRVTLRGPEGREVRLTPGELLNADGSVTQASSGGPMWFGYTLAGRGTESWNPRFTYYGYRYVQVEGAAPEDATDEPADLPRVLSLESLFLSLETDDAGRFECSSPDIARVRDLILTAVRSNLKSVLTDCPHREKLGWLECTYLLAGILTPNVDLATFFEKVARDTVEAQTPEGLVPDIAPEYVAFGGGFRDSPEWGSACVLAPWHAYVTYGDERVLAETYETMQRYVAYLGSKATGHIVSHGLGDWCDVGPGGYGPSQLTSLGLTATALYYEDITVLARVARVLGHEDDARTYEQLGGAVREALNAAFFHPETGSYDRDSQTANAMAVVLDLVPDGYREAVLGRLVDGIRGIGNRVTAGDVGFAYVVRALTDAGRGDVLYDMILQDEGPGYLYQLDRGATSLIESWDASPALSQNHCMLGHAEEWFHRGAAGVRADAGEPGFRRFTVRPQVVPGLTFARGEYDTVRGRIESGWKRDGSDLTLRVVVPANTSAEVWVPARAADAVAESGRPALGGAGITFLRMDDGCAVLHLASGEYTLQSELP